MSRSRFAVAAALAGAMCLVAGGAHAQGMQIQEYAIPTPGSGPAVITHAAGKLYFTESGADRIGQSTQAGVITDVATKAVLSSLEGIAADAMGNLWFTESAASAGHIVRANASLTAFSLGSTPPPPCSPESRPRGIAAGPDGNMWVVLYQCNAVLKFPPAFGPNAGWVYPVPTPDAGVTRIAAGPDGAMWFTEAAANKIGRVTVSGAVTEFPIPTPASGPHGITAGPDGALWFTEFAGNRIGRIAPDGTVTEYPIPTADSGPREIAWGPDGALWFTQFNASQIGRITTSGSITEFPVPTAASAPNGITSGPANTLWFTQFSGNQLGRFLVRPAKSDFNRDGRSDLLWRNSATGENYLYPMHGATILAAEGYLRSVADPDWNVAGVGDFDGDGRADILWRNSSSGENYVYLMDGAAVAGEGYIRSVADPAWQVAGVGDLDGDGRDDILWRNNLSGENYLYPMEGTSIKATEGYLRSVADPAWEVKGAGDFDGDGSADILWRNASSGENYLYPMEGTTIKPTEGYLRTVADQNWRVAQVGDYDGDGTADVLWRHAVTGENYVYFMDGASIAAEGYLRTVAESAWQPKPAVPGGPPLSCQQRLQQLNVSFTPGPANPGVEDPVTVYPPLNGIAYTASGIPDADLYMDCRLALALYRVGTALLARGIDTVDHFGIYNYRCIAGTGTLPNCVLNNHSYATAIDFASLSGGGTTYSVLEDWVIDPDAEPTCSAPTSGDKDEVLHRLVCSWHAERIFDLILTPNYNDAHGNHFHLELNGGATIYIQ